MEANKKSEWVNFPRKDMMYSHYKGGNYTVLTLAKNTTTEETMVVYQSMEFGTVYARPLSEFFEELPPGTSLGFTRRFQLS